MTRDTLGRYPYEVESSRNNLVFRFFPKKPTAEEPNTLVLKLDLGRDDQKKLMRVLVDHL